MSFQASIVVACLSILDDPLVFGRWIIFFLDSREVAGGVVAHMNPFLP